MKYLFYIAKTYSIPIIEPVRKYLKSQGGEYRFYISDIVYKNLPESWDKGLILEDRKAAKEYCPDFVLCPGNFVDFRIPGVKVQLFHGLGVEKPVHYTIRHFFDIYLTSGPFVTKKFLELQQKHRYFRVIETGWPKIDYIVNYNTENIRSRLELPENKKIVLYAPTFSSGMESATDLIKTIPFNMKEGEFWLFKFHELMNPEVVHKFGLINPQNSRILHINDITPYLHAADVMISDTSSVIYEFMVLDKPVITYRTMSLFDKGINITEPDQLRDALDRSLTNPGEYHLKRMQHLKEINPNFSGNISENVIRELNKLDTSEFPSKEKPFNLFRKMQVIWHGIFRKGYLR